MSENSDQMALLSELFTPGYIANPYPTLKKVREYSPLFKPEGIAAGQPINDQWRGRRNTAF
jgi:hypothetical protein